VTKIYLSQKNYRKLDSKKKLCIQRKINTRTSFFVTLYYQISALKTGHTLGQLVETLRYKSENCGFDTRFCHWNFSLTQSFRQHYGPGIDSVSNRNEHQECFLGGKGDRCIRLTNLPFSCADFLEIWEPQPPGTFWACPGL
jgi:hypothetical protein